MPFFKLDTPVFLLMSLAKTCVQGQSHVYICHTVAWLSVMSP